LLLAASSCTPRSEPDPERAAPRASARLPPRAARIYVSADRGESWRASDAGFPERGTVNDFARQSSVVLAGTEAHGLWQSDDGGARWQRSASWTGDDKLNAVAMTPGSWLVGTHRHGVFCSDDQGRTWRRRGDGLDEASVRRLALRTGRLFAGTSAGLFVIDDGETSWRRLTSGQQINGIAFVGAELYAAEVGRVLRSVDDGKSFSVARDGVTAHNLFADGEALFALLYREGLQLSVDHGTTWRDAQQGLPSDTTLYTFQLLRVENRLYAAHWRGVYAADSAGATWHESSRGLEGAITDLLDLGQGRLLAGAGLVR
jgi:photosystem II stability/assembly factor-like uncharacterized protein